MYKVVILILILLASFYFGTGGFLILDNDQRYEKAYTLEKNEVTNPDQITFYNKEVMVVFEQQDLITWIYPYSPHLPSILSFIITAISFGIIGAIGKIMNDTVNGKSKLTDTTNLLLIPFHGGMIGFVILGISYVIPMVLTNDDVTLKPVTVVFLSLFGGVFYLDFFNWLIEKFKKQIFRSNE